VVCNINQAIAPSFQSIQSYQYAKACITAFNSVLSVGHLLWGMGQIHIIKVGQETRLRRDSARLAESLWGMGGTLVTDKCHLFDW